MEKTLFRRRKKYFKNPMSSFSNHSTEKRVKNTAHAFTSSKYMTYYVPR